MSSEGPRRLLEDGHELNALLRGALEAERADGVDEGRLVRIGRAVAFAGASAASPSPPAARNTGADPAGARPAEGWLGAKAPYVVLAAAVLGGLSYLATTESPSALPQPRARTTAVAAPEVEEPSAPATPTFSPSDLPAAPPTAVLPASKPSKASSTVPAPEVDEIALLAKAHDALRSEPARALAICKEHEARFPAGDFAQEREAVAIEALVYLRRKDEAERRWSEFQRRYPSSSHRVHLEGLFAAPSAR